MSGQTPNLHPIYEFRPLPGTFRRGFRRFAGGTWIPDDGEYDLAFIGNQNPENICLYVSVPYQRNILWKWLTGHWTAKCADHGLRQGNPWHYMLRPGTTDWGGDWGCWNHQNRRAGDSGMNKLSGELGCANGRHVDFNLDDPHIAAGLLRIRGTGEIIKFPDSPICMDCGTQWRCSECDGLTYVRRDGEERACPACQPKAFEEEERELRAADGQFGMGA